MRRQQGGDRLVQPGDMLRQVNQRNRQVARAVQDVERYSRPQVS
jgi:hypothetical protein